MQYKTRVLILISTCVILVFIGELTLTKAFFRRESSEVVVTDQKDRHPAASSTQGAVPEKSTVKTSGNDVSNSNNDYIVKKFEDSLSEKIPASDRNKYAFTTYAAGNGSMLFAGCVINDKGTGIIYFMIPDSTGLNPDIKEYAFPGKGAITFDASEENGNILIFSCSNEENGYFEIKKSNAVFENYYLKALKENPYFDPDTYDFQDLKQSEVHLTKEDAIDRAIRKASVGGILGKSKKVSAVLVKYTNKKEPEMPGTNIILEDCPVWVVTFSGVDEDSTGVEPTGKSADNTTGHVLTDFHIFIGANSGIWLGSMSHTSLLD